MFDRKKLRKFMDEKKISGCKLAEELFVSEGMIRHVLDGTKQPSLAMANRIAEMMGCTIDELVLKEDE